jgi:hypothetical protein
LRVFQFDPFTDTREINLMHRIQHIYNTPLRNGKALLFYNVGENLLQFSKNRVDKHEDEDFSVYTNRKYCF